MSQHKDEAIKALRHIIERLGSPEPLVGQERFQLKGTAEYALVEVEAIEELKRARARARDGAATVAEVSGEPGA